MKIIHLIPSLKKGGAERLCLDTCRALQVNGDNNVLVIAFSETNDYTFLTNGLDYKVINAIVVPSLRGRGVVDVSDLQRELDAFQPDVIHVHLFEAVMVVSKLKHNAHLVVHFHDNMLQLENFSWNTIFSKRKLTNFFEKRLVLGAFKSHKVSYLGISQDTLNYMNRVLPRAFRKVKLLNGIDTHRFLKPKDITENSKELFEVSMIGSLVEKKGQALAIATISVLKKRGVSVVLNLLGDGPKKVELEGLAKDLDIQKLVRFYGNVDCPEEYLWCSTLYLHTAKYEPLGLALLEAMAAGLPVVCTDGKGNRDLIEDGLNGYLIQSRNPEELADAIQHVIEDLEQFEAMSAYAQSYAQNYDIEAYVQKLLGIYQFN